ncbi:MAG: hypothetical protein ACR2GC_07250 [Methyloceanibacter sp.]|uniref:hypothetical protein n=1 Tax=Methyloceanibacter sp. TaxID=1965321 RepID=UPI003D9B3803
MLCRILQLGISLIEGRILFSGVRSEGLRLLLLSPSLDLLKAVLNGSSVVRKRRINLRCFTYESSVPLRV